MKGSRLLLFFTLLAVVVFAGFWIFTKTDSSHGEGQKAADAEHGQKAMENSSDEIEPAADSSEPEEEKTNETPADGGQPGVPEKFVAAKSRISQILEKGELIDQATVSIDREGDRTMRKSLYRTPSERFPLLLHEEELEVNPQGEEIRISSYLYKGDQAMVQTPAGTTDEQVASWAAASGHSVRNKIPGTTVYIFGTDQEEALAVDRLIQSARDQFGSGVLAEKDGIQYALETPNDPDFGKLWGMEKIEAEAAWDKTTGDSDVIVGVIDSGISLGHQDLEGNIWVNPVDPVNGIDDDGNGYIDDVNGWDFVMNDSDPNPDDPDNETHGTHVAGTVGAVGNNGTGVVGVNWSVSIMALRFLGFDDTFGESIGTSSDAISAVRYSTSMGAAITNNSWGGGPFNSILENAIQSANTAGIPFVAAAGNDGSNNDSIPTYPSSYEVTNVISVAATDRSDELAGFSNFGQTSVDLAAPGVEIYSTLPGDKYGNSSGTSMASPHVAGALALLKAAEPTIGGSALKSRLLSSVDSVDSLNGKVQTGGRLNVRKLLGVSGGDNGIGSSLSMVNMTWSDSTAYSPHNNGNGVFDAGETIGITYSVRNNGTDVLAVMQSDIEASPTIDNGIARGFDSLTWGNLSMGNLGPGQTRTDRNLRLFCYGNTYVPFTGSFTIDLQYTMLSTGERMEQSFSFTETVLNGSKTAPVPDPPPELPELTLSDLTFDDDPSISPNNNGDGIFNPGELVKMSYKISNNSNATAKIVRSNLSAEPEEIDGVTVGLRAMTDSNLSLGPITPGQTKIDSNLRVFCYGNTPLPYTGTVSISVEYGDLIFTASATISTDLTLNTTKTGSTTNPDAFPSGELTSWLSGLYGDEPVPADAAEADRNYNGRSDLLDFALPSEDRSAEVSVVSRTEDKLTVALTLRDSLPLSAVSLIYSEDLSSWAEASLSEDVVVESSSVEGSEIMKRVTVELEGDASRSQFFRIKVAPANTVVGFSQ